MPSITCKECKKECQEQEFSPSRLKYKVCQKCDNVKSMKYQKLRQKHHAFIPINIVKRSIRKLRKKGFTLPDAWLNVKDYDAFLKKWNNKSIIQSKEIEKEPLLFWFKDLENLTFNNAFPCTREELDSIVIHGKGNVKTGLFVITNGDEIKVREILNKIKE